MPLLIDFKAGDKLIINGAILENAGANSKILVHNRAAILRGREVLSEQDAVTPAARIYFSLQCAYIFPTEREDYMKQFWSYLEDFLKASPSSKPIGDAIKAALEKDNYYKALKQTHKLVIHEMEILQAFAKDTEKAIRDLEKALPAGFMDHVDEAIAADDTDPSTLGDDAPDDPGANPQADEPDD